MWPTKNSWPEPMGTICTRVPCSISALITVVISISPCQCIREATFMWPANESVKMRICRFQPTHNSNMQFVLCLDPQMAPVTFFFFLLMFYNYIVLLSRLNPSLAYLAVKFKLYQFPPHAFNIFLAKHMSVYVISKHYKLLACKTSDDHSAKMHWGNWVSGLHKNMLLMHVCCTSWQSIDWLKWPKGAWTLSSVL